MGKRRSGWSWGSSEDAAEEPREANRECSGTPGAFRCNRGKKRGNCCKLGKKTCCKPRNTTSLFWKRERPLLELWFPICNSTLLAKAAKKVAEKHINVNIRPKPPPKGDGGMAAVP